MSDDLFDKIMSFIGIVFGLALAVSFLVLTLKEIWTEIL